METKTLKSMKGSDIHKIIAAVLEIMEKVNVPNLVDAKLQTDKEDESIWKMDFQKKETNLDELTTIKNELGSNFSVNISSNSKSLLISVVAKSDDFISLLEKKQSESIPSRDMFDNQEQKK